MSRLLLLLCLLPLSLRADGPADDARLWLLEAPALLRALPATPKAAAPVRADDGSAALGADRLRAIAVAGSELTGYLHGDGRLWIWLAGDEGGWRGPKTLKTLTRAVVLRQLERHASDSGQQGFYAGRFATMRATLGPPAVAHLADIARTEPRPQIRQLAIEALGQLRFPARAVPALEALLETREGRRWRPHVAVSLARLGKQTLLERVSKDYTAIADADGRPRTTRARAAGAAGLLWARLGKYDRALEHYHKATTLAPEVWGTHYNLACTYARLKRIDDAYASLGRSIDAGFTEWEWLRMDGDLKPLRADKARWRALLARQHAGKTPKQTPKQPPK